MELTKEQISEILNSADIPNLPIIDEKVFNTDFYQVSTYNDYEEVSRWNILFIDLNIDGFNEFNRVMIVDKDDELIIGCVAQEAERLYDELTSYDSNRFLDNIKSYIDFEEKAKDDIRGYGAGEFLSGYNGMEYCAEDSDGNEYYVYIRE